MPQPSTSVIVLGTLHHHYMGNEEEKKTYQSVNRAVEVEGKKCAWENETEKR